jgi:hypothetical protein
MVPRFSLTLIILFSEMFQNLKKRFKQIPKKNKNKLKKLGKETKELDEIFGGIYNLFKWTPQN